MKINQKSIITIQKRQKIVRKSRTKRGYTFTTSTKDAIFKPKLIEYGCEYMIIVEGIDGTGKTSLTERMKEVGFESYHLTYDEKSEEGYLTKMLRH